MKSNSTHFKILAVLLFSLSCCKKEEPKIVPISNYTSSRCKILSFTYGGNMNILTKYNSDNQLIEIIEPRWLLSPYEYRRTFEYENGELKRIIVPSEDPDRLPVPNKSYTEVEYEYGKYGIEKIHRFGRADFTFNRPDNLMETERFEFQYNGNDKPVSMTYYVNFGSTEDKFMLGLKSNYEYDSNGNLLKEISYKEALGSAPGTTTMNYLFDDKINTIKQLNYIYFGPGSGAQVFSTNNLISQDIVGSDQPGTTIPFILNYDSKNNVTKFPFSFSNVVWDCQ